MLRTIGHYARPPVQDRGDDSVLGDARRGAGFLDGAHAFHHDAPATVILKELLKPGGIFLFDDYDWTFGASPTQRPAVKPEILKLYTEEQIQTPHLRLICDLFMDSDPDYEKVNLNFVGRERRRAYRKHAGG